MNAIFMNSENSKTFDPHRLLLKLAANNELIREVMNVLLYKILVT